tara:strand:- start:55 stop:528 length:474 start_codon:yes stop_codon:yes gene_type:complete
MIISCPSCKKKFEIDENLIPTKGRNLQCGSCLNVWFYKLEQNILDLEIKDNTTDLKEEDNEIIIKENIKKESFSIKKNNIENTKDKALIKYEKKTKYSLINFLGYFVVIFLSFVALLIILDTFQGLLLAIFPKLELILFNFYETLLDIYLFIKDFIR